MFFVEHFSSFYGIFFAMLLIGVSASANNPLPPASLIPHDPDFQQVLVEVLPGNEDTTTMPFLTQYDLGMQEWLQTITVWDGRVMPVVFAAPLRAFSTYRELLQKGKMTPLVAPEDGDINFAKAPLPFISYTRGDFRPGLRQNQNYPIRNLAFLDGTNKRRTGYTRYPLSMVVPYQIEIWTKTFQAQAFLVQTVLSQFWPKMAYWYLKNCIVENLLMPIKLLGVSDTSTLEGGTDGERVLRITFSLEVEGQMFFPIMQAPTFLRERDQIGTVKQDGSDERIDLVIDLDHSEGQAGPSTDEIAELPANPQ